ncbi:MAG: hypothetical protein ABW022_10570 [Actinoplanes sp.]
MTRPAAGEKQRLRDTSPGRLQLLLATLLALGLLTGLVAGITANSARAGTTDLGGRAQPLLVEAETIYSALADADTTAAQAFLAGGLEPAELTRRYDADLDRATVALTSAARRTPAGSPADDAVHALSAGVARYAALVATARADNRQGLPVGASYLAAASRLNRDTLLPQAQTLFRIAQEEVDDGFGSATSGWWVLLTTLLLTGLLVALGVTQSYLSRSTRRTFNVPLLAATGVTVVLTLVLGAVLIGQNVHLNRADRAGSTPVEMIAESRILALQIRGDEALTLAARGSGAAYEKDLQDASARLTLERGPLINSWSLLDPELGQTMDRAARNLTNYLDQHKKVRALDDGGDYEGAVKLAIGPETTRAFEGVRADLDAALTDRKEVFTAEIGSAGRGLGLLTVFAPVLALIVCLLAVMGIRARLEEYR